MADKSTIDEIRERFDHDVERFSNLETGQTATIDSPLMLELVAEAVGAVNPLARDLLDVGCGAGNYALMLLGQNPGLNVTLVDLSLPMLERAQQRVSAATTGTVQTLQGDIRDIPLGRDQFDVIVAAMVLHHLRTESEWRAVFTKFHQALRPGGSVWIVDHVHQTMPELQHAMTRRWGEYLAELKDRAYRDTVFAYVEKEDSPQTLMFQLDTLREVGFARVDVLHKTNLFAAFGAVKS